jgi:L-methionine (R)-S-oxide reductase
MAAPGYHCALGDVNNLEQWLQETLVRVDASSGTVHLHENDGLRLVAAVNIPPPLQKIVEWVPNGKGMAGLALQRGEPMQTCNLQEDTSGNVKPGAKTLNAQAAIALPVRDHSGEIRAVVGLAFQQEREFTAADLDQLMRVMSTLPEP